MAEQIPSIIDVAQRAGVSIATASRVISRSTYPVSENTRQKVLKAAEELHYTPNSLARSLRTQRSNLIAVLVGDNTDSYFAEIARGVEEVANEHDYLTIICNAERDPKKEIHYLRSLKDYRIGGVIFAGGGLTIPGHTEELEALVQEMRQRGTGIVTLAQHTLRVPSVQVDNFDGAKKMTARLIAAGHRRIAFVAGPSDLLVANIRMQGYMTALIEHGYPIDPTLILPGNFTRLGGEQAIYKIAQFAADQRPSAIFGANDETAFGILLGLRKQGWHVPNDVEVCGFGDLPFAQFVTPSLTTVHIPLRDLGRTGANDLLSLLNNEEIAPIKVLPTAIIERETTKAIAH